MASIFSDTVIADAITTFKKAMQLPAYNSILEWLIRDAYEKNIRLDLWNENYSKYQRGSIPSGYTHFITIKRKPKLTSNREILFDLMHEMGHYWDHDERPVSNAPRNVAANKRREMRAWTFADQLFATFPELQADEPEYTAYKMACLASYSIDT